MKTRILKYIKYFFIVVTVVLIILLVFGLVLTLDWPWWVGIFLLLGLIGLWFGVLFIRKIVLRSRERNFVQQVVEEDESHLGTLVGKEHDELKALQDRWKEAIESLRKSHLRKYGNPLYVLPWYMVLGESGSGKTTAIKSARLSSPFAEVSRTTGISGTRNCDWWFFEQAIILDTAGRYAIPIDEGRDKQEWQKFLGLLMKYRKKEPINGLIVTIAADKLLEALPESLEEDGRNIRRRVDELMRVLGAKFPVYVLVTKCDLVQGMNQFCERLPETSLEQPMGVINQDLSTDVPAFLERSINTIGERLRNLRLHLLLQPERGEVDPSLMLFPEEFENLKGGLGSFLRGAFQENPYQETPIMRGLFFSSGCQEGSPFSHFLNALGLIGERDVLPGTSRGLFLHEFFARLLPKDRGLFAPTGRAIRWLALTRNLGLTERVALGLDLCGLLSYSFFKNITTLRGISHEFEEPPIMTREFITDLITMNRFSNGILTVEGQNRNWWLPRFGLKESIDVEYSLKEKYCNQFQHGFLSYFDTKLKSDMTDLTGDTPGEIIGEYIAHLVRRINLLKGHLEGEGFGTLKDKPQPSYVSLLSSAGEGVGDEVRKAFGSLYLYYLIWREHSGDMNNEINVLQSWLKRLLALPGTNPTWLVAWMNNQGTVPALTLEDFWGGSLAVSGERTISPAFTRKGKELIDSFVKEIESALPDPLVFARPKKVFEGWYRTAVFEKWGEFGEDFLRGIERLKDDKEFQEMAERVSTDEGPYFSFLMRIADDLEPLAKGDDVPGWIQKVYTFLMLKELAAKLGDTGKLGKIAEKGKRLFGKVGRKPAQDGKAGRARKYAAVGEIQGGREGEETGLDSLDPGLYREYEKTMAAVVPISNTQKQAYQITLQAFGGPSEAEGSPFPDAYRAAGKLKDAMAFREEAQERIFWSLIIGPLNYLWTYGKMETACYLQDQWEEAVLSESKGGMSPQVMQSLLADDGPVWRFVKETAQPFVGWGVGKGYSAEDAEILGGTIPFKPSFFSFLNMAGQALPPSRRQYNVHIRGLPTDANDDARVKPHGTRLELQCSDGVQSMVNLHYPVIKNFIWSAETCNDVIFRIEIGDVVLTKKYTGSEAFAEFLQDFRGGSRTFYPHEFPDEGISLERLGIRFIRVNYEFGRDYRAVLDRFRTLPESLPRSIAWCWDQ